MGAEKKIISHAMTYVFGDSMLPHLKDGELLLFEPVIKNIPKIGELVVARNQNTGETIVHRMCPLKTLKGDSCKVIDNTYHRSQKFTDDFYRIEGKVSAKVFKDGKELHYISYKNPILKALNFTQAVLSFFNHRQFRVIHKIATKLLRLNGSIIIKFENYLLRQKYEQSRVTK